jgi:hypothetical protein
VRLSTPASTTTAATVTGRGGQAGELTARSAASARNLQFVHCFTCACHFSHTWILSTIIYVRWILSYHRISIGSYPPTIVYPLDPNPPTIVYPLDPNPPTIVYPLDPTHPLLYIRWT